MKKKYHIRLVHSMREMLAEIILGLPDFELDDASKKKIVVNRKVDATRRMKKISLVSVVLRMISRCVVGIQKVVGLINFKVAIGKEAEILFAHGGFLITNRPYVTYIEKATQIYGYTAKNYNKPLPKHILKFFLRDVHLRKIFFLSKAALDGMANIPSMDSEMRSLIKNKGAVIYPPISRLKNPNIERFRNVTEGVSFLYISNNFYGKGGLEVFHAFSKLQREKRDIRLVIISDIRSFDKADYSLLSKNKSVELHDTIFTKEELFEKFYDTCHVLCYPTYSDSFSSVVNEAISSYLPVITTDFYSIPERVVDGCNGFVCPTPFPNYDNHFVIQSEHFTDQPDFLEKIRRSQREGALRCIEDFLYEKMKILSMDSNLLFRMAMENRRIYEEKIDSVKIREKVNKLFLEELHLKK